MNDFDVEKLTWMTPSSNKTSIKDILTKIRQKNPNDQVHIGCDSHFQKNKCIFAVVIAIYRPGNGGTFFFSRKRMDRDKLYNMNLRLLKEVEYSLKVADYIAGNLMIDDISVHVDINPNNNYKSSSVFTPATSWVKSQGYKCLYKPYSWASSWLADSHAR